MSETTAPGPRHARSDTPAPVDSAPVDPVPVDGAPTPDEEPPTTAIPTVIPGEFTDDSTQVLPIVPVQRGAAPFVPAPRRSDEGAGLPDLLAAAGPAPAARPRRVLPAVLAGVTACLLAAGIVVGVGGAGGAEMNDQPSVSGTP